MSTRDPSEQSSTSSSSEAGNRREPKGELRKWGESLLVAIIIVVIVRTFFFDLFRIPTPSMEKNLLVGDYLVVSKLHYGPRLPMSVGIPLTSAFTSGGIYLPGVTFPYKRLPGFGSIQRWDPIVFNYPPNERPIDRKVHYVKRVIGMPGETLEVRDKVVHVDGRPLPLGEGMQQYWTVTKSDARYQIPRTRMESVGISEVRPTQDATTVHILATPAAAREVSTWSWVRSIEPYVIQNADYGDRLYPPNRGYTPDNYGPVHVPEEGESVELTPSNWATYRPVIVRYEGHEARQMTDSTFAIDGQRTTSYTFEQSYFFVMGDNRDNSQDSRFWGFVPMDHVVGRAVITYFSWDSESWLPRFGRIFNPIEAQEVSREQTVMEMISGETSLRRARDESQERTALPPGSPRQGKEESETSGTFLKAARNQPPEALRLPTPTPLSPKVPADR